LQGRTGEIEKLLACIVEDWRSGERTAEGAEASVRSYLEELHGAVRHLFGLEAVLECCFADVVSTMPLRVTEDATRHVPVPDAPAHDTAVVDPREVSAWIRAYPDRARVGAVPAGTGRDAAPGEPKGVKAKGVAPRSIKRSS
jgi:hypothetical protein